MGMAAVIYKKGAPDNFVWEEIKVGSPERGQVRLRSTAVGVNFAGVEADTGLNAGLLIGGDHELVPAKAASFPNARVEVQNRCCTLGPASASVKILDEARARALLNQAQFFFQRRTAAQGHIRVVVHSIELERDNHAMRA